MRQLRVIKAAKANHSFKCALEGLVAVSCASGVPLRDWAAPRRSPSLRRTRAQCRRLCGPRAMSLEQRLAAHNRRRTRKLPSSKKPWRLRRCRRSIGQASWSCRHRRLRRKRHCREPPSQLMQLAHGVERAAKVVDSSSS